MSNTTVKHTPNERPARPESEFQNALALIVNGRLTAARQILSREPFRKGDVIRINTKTAPTPSGDHYMNVTVKEPVGMSQFISEECDPYLGYNRWDVYDLANV
jgi:hypothetical protein